MLSRLSLVQKQYLAIAVSLASFVVFGVIALRTIDSTRVGGQVYTRIQEGKDTIADILPPPLFIIETYFTVLQLQQSTDAAERGSLIKHIEELQDAYNARREHWSKTLEDGKLKDSLLAKSDEAAGKFFEVVERELLPAVRNNDAAATQSVIQKRLAPIFVEHRSAVEQTVGFANERIAADEVMAAEEVSSGRLWMLLAGLMLSLLIAIPSIANARSMRERLASAREVLDALAAGDVNRRLDASRADEIGEVARALNAALEAMRAREAQGLAQEVGSVFERIADRDLTARVVNEEEGIHARLKIALNTAMRNVDEALSQVSAAAHQVAAASNEISVGGQSLAQSTSQSASSIEEVTASLQEMASMSMQNARNAQEAKSLAKGASLEAEHGAQSMRNLSQTIERIKQSADRTAKIVKTIDDIAFQTNLLALNAAVEAARAGEAGKGFAVVAEEVRNLAMRSAEAAKNTSALIEESVRNADEGVAFNRDVLSKLSDIATQVQRVGEVMTEIAAASEQQNEGVSQINRAVEDLSRVTQQNAATSEETASTAEELSSQSHSLADLVSAFRLSHAGAPAAPSGHVAPPSLMNLRAPRLTQVKPKNTNGIKPVSKPLIPFDDDVSTLAKF